MVERISKEMKKELNTPTAWGRQLRTVYAGGRAICPVCGNTETEHSFSVFEDGVGFGDFYCPKCGATSHMCRLKFPEGIKIDINEI